MAIVKALQKPEESVRRPNQLADNLLDEQLDNNQRRAIGETLPVTLTDTLSAIVSQLKQILYGDLAGRWTDVPPITLETLAELQQAPVSTYLIQPGQTVSIESFPFASFFAAKFHVELKDTTAGHFGSFEISTSKNGSDVTDSLYSILGFRFSTIVNFHVSGADALLDVTNNEAHALSVKITKLSD